LPSARHEPLEAHPEDLSHFDALVELGHRFGLEPFPGADLANAKEFGNHGLTILALAGDTVFIATLIESLAPRIPLFPHVGIIGFWLITISSCNFITAGYNFAHMSQNLITQAIEIVGLSALARGVGLSYQAILKWEKAGTLPRTEWTGETNYAETIEKLTARKVTKRALLASRMAA
jgi:hypothetical protein